MVHHPGYDRFEGRRQGEHKMARALMPVRTTSAHWLATGLRRRCSAFWNARAKASTTMWTTSRSAARSERQTLMLDRAGAPG